MAVGYQFMTSDINMKTHKTYQYKYCSPTSEAPVYQHISQKSEHLPNILRDRRLKFRLGQAFKLQSTNLHLNPVLFLSGCVTSGKLPNLSVSVTPL